MLNKSFFVFYFLLFLMSSISAQVPTVDIKKSSITQKVNDKNYYIHIVEKGQTLFSVSRTYEVPYQEVILKSDIDKIKIGDTLWVPVKLQESPIDVYFNYYEVKKGETIYSLCRRYNVKEATFIALNPELDTSSLKVGQVVKIPRLQDDPETISSKEKENEYQKGPPSQKIEKEIVEVEMEISKESQIIIKPRKSKQEVSVVLMMPLYLYQIDEISISKFDIDQRKIKNYKNFEFIQFYEGILMGLNKLEAKGYKVSLYVYDVSQNDSEKVNELFQKEEVQTCDFIIALLYQSAFNTAATLAKKYNTFIINPLSERDLILDNNPYVIKYASSTEAYASSLLALIKKDYPKSNILLIHSNKPEEKASLDSFLSLLEKQEDLTYTALVWNPKIDFYQQLQQDKKNIVISLYDKDPQSNTIYVSLILNKLAPFRKNPPILVGPSNWLDMQNIDLNYLERLNFHYADNVSLNHNTEIHSKFINDFIENYQIDPNVQFAGVGHDIIIHFVSGLQTKNESFWTRPNFSSSEILHPTNYKRSKPSSGFENQRHFFYKISNFQNIPAN